MIVFHAETKVLDTKIFPQHTIADLNSGIIYCFVWSGEAFTVKGNEHTHAHTHTHTRTHARTHAHTRQSRKGGCHSILNTLHTSY